MSDYDAVAPFDDRWSAHMTEDVGFDIELAGEVDEPVPIRRAETEFVWVARKPR